jgi:tRNA threonylcarbamoyl adenosine modification protein YjeE
VTRVLHSASEAETLAIARTAAASLGAGDVVLLHGDLGVGKTVFVRGLAAGLGLDDDVVSSPTFTLVHEYAGGRLPLLHLDLYRLERVDLDEIGLDPDLAARGLVVVEWPDRLRHPLPGAVLVTLSDRGGDEREITIERVAARPPATTRDTGMERAVPILPTDDLAVARTFYVDGLGFSVSFDTSDDGRTGLLGLARGTIRLTLDCPMAGHGRAACVALEVADADAYYREWSGQVRVLRAPRDEPWGARTFDLLDPSGNTLFVIGPLAAAS